MNFTVAVKLAREVETLCVWAGDSDCVVPEQFLWTPCDVIRAEDGVLQLAGADPSILTLEIRYQRDQTYYGQPYYCPGLAWLPLKNKKHSTQSVYRAIDNP